MQHKILFVDRREDTYNISRVAICEFTADPPREYENSFMVLSRAVSKWAKNYGHIYPLNVLSIGKLSFECGRNLKLHGISKLKIDIVSGQDADFNAQLVQDWGREE